MDHPENTNQITSPEKREPRSVGEALPIEMARVRDEVMPGYLEIGPAGAFALHNMRADLDAATKALAEQDAIGCIRSLEALRGYET